jgi:hypothetical protein
LLPRPDGGYSPSDWEDIAARASFGDPPDDQVLVLYRHWLWADYSHEVYEHKAETRQPADGLHEPQLTSEE